MPSMKCYQCGKVKRCKMFVEDVQGFTVVTYLCAPCRKELGR